MKASNLLFVIIAASLSACVNNKEDSFDGIDGEVREVTVIGPALIQFESISGGAHTKGTSVQDDDALIFSWAVGDTLGIFPNKGNQVEFPISATQGSTSASFDGGGWALKNNASYAAYYPFSVWNYHRNNETILLDYSGQVQNGNGGFAHLSAYDYLASGKTSPENSAVTFQMERQGAILYIDIVVPEPSTITSLEIFCDEAIFVEKASLDISGDEPVVKPVETKESLTLSFKNTETTVSNETVRAYMAVQPVDFSDKTVTATLYTSNGSYSAQVVSREVKKGSAAFLRFAGDFTPTIIEFADAEVKRLCVENWDTDGDGELSYQEAAAVTDLGEVFRANQTITTFNELEYFKGLISIGYGAFRGCSSLTSIVIPEGVTSIGVWAFYSCSSLTTIMIPEGVTSIGNQSFGGCSSLTTIMIPEGVASIGDGAFRGCISLTSVVIPEGVASIGDWAFGDCSSLTTILIPEGVTSIGGWAFCGCRGLTSIVIPDSVTSIGDYAFYSCDSLTSIMIPEGVTSIGNQSFGGCSSLTTILIPEGVASIGDGAFYSCSSLTSIVIPDSVTSIGDYAFCGCESLISILLPDSITSIGDSAFYGCIFLKSIVIPDSVTNIGTGAFDDCRSLTSIVIPDSVTSIGNCIFCRCYSLSEFQGKFASSDGRCLIVDGVLNSFAPNGITSYSIPDSVTSIGYRAFEQISLTSIVIPDSITSISDHAFSACSSLTSIVIPDSVTSIGDYAFCGCESLISILLPEGVTSIGTSAFAYCTTLSKIECKSQTPPTADRDMFQDTNNCPIYVPNESVEAYKAAPGWSDYAGRIFGIEVEGSVIGPDPQNPD